MSVDLDNFTYISNDGKELKISKYHISIFKKLEGMGYEISNGYRASITASKDNMCALFFELENQLKVQILTRGRPIMEQRRIMEEVVPLYLNQKFITFTYDGSDYIVVGEGANRTVYRIVGWNIDIKFNGKPQIDFMERYVPGEFKNWRNAEIVRDFQFTPEIEEKIRKRPHARPTFEGVKVNMW